jgi:hypothetical protein
MWFFQGVGSIREDEILTLLGGAERIGFDVEAARRARSSSGGCGGLFSLGLVLAVWVGSSGDISIKVRVEVRKHYLDALLLLRLGVAASGLLVGFAMVVGLVTEAVGGVWRGLFAEESVVEQLGLSSDVGLDGGSYMRGRRVRVRERG